MDTKTLIKEMARESTRSTGDAIGFLMLLHQPDNYYAANTFNVALDVIKEQERDLQAAQKLIEKMRNVDPDDIYDVGNLIDKLEAELAQFKLLQKERDARIAELEAALQTLLDSCSSERVIHDPHPVTVKLISAPSQAALEQARKALRTA